MNRLLHPHPAPISLRQCTLYMVQRGPIQCLREGISGAPRRGIVSISGKSQFVVPSLAERQSSPTIPNPPARHPSWRRLRENNTPLTESGATARGEEGPVQPARGRRHATTNLMPDPSTVAGGLVVRILKTRVIKNMTKNGKYARFSILLAVGNGAGGLGVAHAKAVAAADAVAKATRLATRSLEYYERWQQRTLHHDDVVKYKATILYVRPGAPETGRRAHPTIIEMCRCMGIKDVSAKVHGSRNPLNVAQAFLLALQRQKTPTQVAEESGMRIVDVLKVYQQGCEELTRTLRAERYSTDHLRT